MTAAKERLLWAVIIGAAVLADGIVVVKMLRGELFQ